MSDNKQLAILTVQDFFSTITKTKTPAGFAFKAEKALQAIKKKELTAAEVFENDSKEDLLELHKQECKTWLLNRAKNELLPLLRKNHTEGMDFSNYKGCSSAAQYGAGWDIHEAAMLQILEDFNKCTYEYEAENVSSGQQVYEQVGSSKDEIEAIKKQLLINMAEKLYQNDALATCQNFKKVMTWRNFMYNIFEYHTEVAKELTFTFDEMMAKADNHLSEIADGLLKKVRIFIRTIEKNGESANRQAEIDFMDNYTEFRETIKSADFDTCEWHKQRGYTALEREITLHTLQGCQRQYSHWMVK